MQNMGSWKGKRWIGVDFDQTLHRDDGSPIQPMVDRVKKWISEGKEIRIVTARMNGFDNVDNDRSWSTVDQENYIREWCVKNIGNEMKYVRIQHQKGPGMIELWDDKVVAVEPNTGRRLSPSRIEEDE